MDWTDVEMELSATGREDLAAWAHDEAARLNSELQKRDKCSFIGPMRDCPTHGEGAEIKKLRLAEEGAKEAFGVIVEQKRDLEAKCKRLQQLLDGAHDIIRRSSMTPNAELSGPRPLAAEGSRSNAGLAGTFKEK